MKTSKIVKAIGKQNFQDAVDSAIALGFNDTSNPVTFKQGATYEADEYIQELINPGTNPELMTVTPIVLAFGEVEIDTPSILPIAVTGTNMTGNMDLSSSDPLFVLETEEIVPDVDDAIDQEVDVTFTPTEVGDFMAYITIEATDGLSQSLVVIVTGTGVEP